MLEKHETLGVLLRPDCCQSIGTRVIAIVASFVFMVTFCSFFLLWECQGSEGGR